MVKRTRLPPNERALVLYLEFEFLSVSNTNGEMLIIQSNGCELMAMSIGNLITMVL